MYGQYKRKLLILSHNTAQLLSRYCVVDRFSDIRFFVILASPLWPNIPEHPVESDCINQSHQVKPLLKPELLMYFKEKRFK